MLKMSYVTTPLPGVLDLFAVRLADPALEVGQLVKDGVEGLQDRHRVPSLFETLACSQGGLSDAISGTNKHRFRSRENRVF